MIYVKRDPAKQKRGLQKAQNVKRDPAKQKRGTAESTERET